MKRITDFIEASPVLTLWVVFFVVCVVVFRIRP